MKITALFAIAFFASTLSSAAGNWIDSCAVKAADQLVYQASLTGGNNRFPRAVYTDYSIPEVAYHLQRSPKDFYPEIELRRHPSLDEYLTLRCGNYDDWTSGFFPGSLWLAYKLTGNEDAKTLATSYTNALLPVSFMTTTHDLGFMVNCSYGNALEMAPNDSINAVIVRTADNLISRFDPEVGLIRSWDFGDWNYPVIIDNMMNLQLLFKASAITGDPHYRDVAVKHADKTMQNHFRPDFTCYHVVSYNPDGSVQSKGTFQGKSHDSAWARGQAWALYGYTDCYTFTGDKKYLERACAIADMFMERNVSPDNIPYWDFDARDAADTPRDASAGAICASALLQLGSYLPQEQGQRYKDYATGILRTLSTPEYFADLGENAGFVLKHSTGSLPHGSEIDTPLSYADYYYLEGLSRLKESGN